MSQYLDSKFSGKNSYKKFEQSKAAAESMRALQSRIQSLETENAHLTNYLGSIYERQSSEQKSFYQEVSEQLQDFMEKEESLKFQISRAEALVQNCLQERSDLETRLDYLENVQRDLQTKQRQNSNFVQISTQETQYQLEKAYKNYLSLEEKQKLIDQKLQREEQELELLKTDYHHQKAISKTLFNELKYLKESEDFEDSVLQSSQQINNQLSSDRSQMAFEIDKLSIEIKALQKIDSNQKENIKHLEKQLYNKALNKKSFSQTERSKSSQRPSNRHIGAHLQEETLGKSQSHLPNYYKKLDQRLEKISSDIQKEKLELNKLRHRYT